MCNLLCCKRVPKGLLLINIYVICCMCLPILAFLILKLISWGDLFPLTFFFSLLSLDRFFSCLFFNLNVLCTVHSWPCFQLSSDVFHHRWTKNVNFSWYPLPLSNFHFISNSNKLGIYGSEDIASDILFLVVFFDALFESPNTTHIFYSHCGVTSRYHLNGWTVLNCRALVFQIFSLLFTFSSWLFDIYCVSVCVFMCVWILEITVTKFIANDGKLSLLENQPVSCKVNESGINNMIILISIDVFLFAYELMYIII